MDYEFQPRHLPQKVHMKAPKTAVQWYSAAIWITQDCFEQMEHTKRGIKHPDSIVHSNVYKVERKRLRSGHVKKMVIPWYPCA